MPKLPRLSSRKLLALLKRLGFHEHHTTGSHINLRHRLKSHLHIVIPARRTELVPKTLKSILVQAELEVEDIL